MISWAELQASWAASVAFSLTASTSTDDKYPSWIVFCSKIDP
jgi:hypothetical protein